MQDSKKVYMILTNGFDPDIRVYKEAKYLVSRDYDVEILCWDRKCIYKDRECEEVEGIKIKRFFIPSVPGSGMKQILPYLKFISSVRKYLKDKAYNYLHCHDFDGILVGLFTKKKKEKKLIFDMHEIYNNYAYAKNRFFQTFFRKILKKSNYIIYVNDEQIKDIKQVDKLVFLPNYPDKEIYEPIDKTQYKKIRVNYIGSLRDYDSLKSLADVAIKDSKIEVSFYGMGVCYEQIDREYQDSSVKVYGKYDGIKQSGEIYRNTDILYCSYNPEVENWKNAFPVKLYEAIITLTPIIVTKNTVVGDFVERYGIGETISYQNRQSIIDAVNKINNNYSEYIENITCITNEYHWKNVANNLQKIYNWG